MLPLFWIAEILQNTEKQRILKIQPLLDEIKDVKNKKEKHYYKKEIYRKNDYHPIYSLTGLVGIVFQIPFFLAAYFMILKHPSLQGVSFGFIDDLSKPDGIINLKHITINLLPIIMGLVSLLPIFIYSTKNIEKIQSIAFSIFFSILLYKMSSALVLYWTMNNLFGLSKKMILSKLKSDNFVTKKISNISISFSFIFLLLFSLFPLFSFYNTNFYESKISDISFLLFINIVLTYLIFIIFKKLFKDENKTFLICSLSIIYIYSYGYLNTFFLSFINEIGMIILVKLLILFLFIILFFIIILSKKELNNIVGFFKILSASIFFIVVLKILNKALFQKSTFIDSLGQMNLISDENKLNEEQFPNIYFIVLDGYDNTKTLNDVFDYDNTEFDTFLEEKGFYVANNSRSNYLTTFLSLCSTFNMNYINNLSDELGISSKTRNKPYQMINKSKVSEYLKAKGYTLVNFKSGWGITDFMGYFDYNIPKNKFFNDFSVTFIQTTIFRILLNNVISRKYAESVLYQFENIPKLENINSPYFVFAHIVSPHPPYVFDENGKTQGTDIKMNNDWDSKERYISQLKFINSKTKELVNSILEKNNGSIVVLQSDHGTSFNSKIWKTPLKKDFVQERSKILNAILLNNYSKDSLYPEISSVNTFRVIFNSVFEEEFKILGDSTYFSTYNRPYDFKNVTEMITD
tara:strand:- start:96 stop:2165 length:2070 start_codon:yes stop_codon:yes gene_type:complete